MLHRCTRGSPGVENEAPARLPHALIPVPLVAGLWVPAAVQRRRAVVYSERTPTVHTLQVQGE